MFGSYSSLELSRVGFNLVFKQNIQAYFTSNWFTFTYNIFFRFKIQSSLSLLPVCIQIFIQLQFDSNFFSVSFLICEIFIELRKISAVLLHSYKESIKKYAITHSFFNIQKVFKEFNRKPSILKVLTLIQSDSD